MNQYACDYDSVLIQFCSLRKVPKATIFVPEDVRDVDQEGEGYMLHRVQKIMRCHKPFGIHLKAGSVWPDDITQKHLDSTYVLFEDPPDMLPGRTAGMLRLHRFSAWYDSNGISTYLKELERISSNVKIKLHMLKERYILMLVFYPLSTVMQRIRKRLDLPPSLRFSKFALENQWDENE
jgi:hypothetical protein